jgi:bifunctional DNA-binding transcriptional regulator/antitoxin component of YhaV-PrlF toxin-antitoxin module
MAKKRDEQQLQEAKRAYVAEARSDNPAMSFTKLSSKNQITLPVAYVRNLGLNPGDEIVVWLGDGHITLERRLHGRELLDSLQGSIKSDAWGSKEKIDKWVSDLRDEWERG